MSDYPTQTHPNFVALHERVDTHYPFQSDRPVHPNLGALQKRLDTYNHCDFIDHPIGIKKLCEAGFYYEGPNDKVRCFWCDGAMELWEKDDKAWIDHAK